MARINEIYNKPLRDPIHDYINLTPIEQTIIDTPVFQRLRYILQNSSAYLTYPNNNTTRFMHSLGVMNIGGKYFVRSLENAHTNVLVKYLSIVDKVFSKYEDNLEIKPDVFQKEWLDMVGNASKFNHHPKGDGCFKSIQKIDGNYKYEIGSPKKRLKHDPLFLINTLWQAVRLCALIHDIGHLPMSHIFEKAISSFLADYPETQVKDFYEKELKSKENEFLEILDDPLKAEFDTAYSLPLHELRGLYIFKHIYPDPDKHYNKLVFKIAKSIYLYSDKLYDAVVRDLNKNEQVLNCLHNIISSEVDCDRLDYCVRDPHASGLELGAVDVHRIVDNMILYIREDGNFHISPTAKSQSAIESFFHQRYLEYKYLIYHHNVLRMDGIFQKILIMLFEEITKEKNKSRVIINILDEFSFYLKDPGPKKYRFLSGLQVEQYDDYWVRTLFNRLSRDLKEEKKKNNDFDDFYERLTVLLDTFLFREVNNVHSLWKRESDYQKTCKELTFPDDKKSFKPFVLLKNDSINIKIFILQIKKVEKILEKDNVVLIYNICPPKIFSEDIKTGLVFYENDNITVPAAEISPYIKSLKAVANETPNIHISLVSKDIKDKKKLFNNCKKIINKGLNDYIMESIIPKP